MKDVLDPLKHFTKQNRLYFMLLSALVACGQVSVEAWHSHGFSAAISPIYEKLDKMGEQISDIRVDLAALKEAKNQNSQRDDQIKSLTERLERVELDQARAEGEASRGSSAD